tara:strand:+ start:16540 stop:18558 length:2019 start_codon:yes stop_codon:yes gene_type:complete
LALGNAILQHRQTACGLAALIMIDHHFGGQTNACQFEAVHGPSDQQWSAADMILNATHLGLSGQAIELEPAELAALTLPCVLHWQLNHFVVLRAIRWGRYIIDDPAMGRLSVDRQALKDHFTGIALTFQPEIEARLGAMPGQSSLRGSPVLKLQSDQLVALIFFLMVGALQASIPLIIKFILDDIVMSHDIALLQSTTMGFLLILIAAPLMTHLQARLMLGCSQNLEQNALRRLLKNLTAAPSGTLGPLAAQTCFKRVKHLHHFGQFYGAEGVQILGDLLLAIALVSTLFLINPETALLMILTSAVLISLSLWFTPQIASAEKLAGLSEQTRLEHLMELLNHGEEIRRYGAEQPFLHRINQGLHQSHHQQSLGTHRKASMALAHQLTTGVSLSIVLYWIAFQTMAGHMTLGGLYLILAYRGLLTQHVLSICQQFTGAASAQDIRRDLRDLIAAADITASAGLKVIDPPLPMANLTVKLANPTQSTQIGALRYERLTSSSSFSAASHAILTPGSKPDSKAETGRDQGAIYRPLPIATAFATDAIFNTTILANITMMAAVPDRARVEHLIRKMALLDAINQHPFGLDTVIGPDQHRFDRSETARLILTRALYQAPGTLVLELPSVIVACEVMQDTLRQLLGTGLTIELRSHDFIPPIAGLRLVWQTRHGWLLQP